MRFVMDENPRHAKFASRLIVCMKNGEQLCTQVVEVRRPWNFGLAAGLIVSSIVVDSGRFG